MVDYSQCNWIWAEDNARKCDRVLFRRAISLDKTPKSALLSFCARDTASLYVNGKPVALGVRGAAQYDIAKYLVKGENVLGFDCLYYGEAANGYVPPKTSGLIVSSPALSLISDAQFTAYRPYAEPDGGARPSGRYFGFDSFTDGSRGELGGVFTAEYGSTLFAAATEYGAGTETEEEAIAQAEYAGTVKVRKMQKTVEGVTVTYVCDLGGEKTFYPVVELVAMGTERVELKTDRYRTHGGWGTDETLTGVRGVYVCRNGMQVYACPVPLRGSELVIVAPATVTVRTVDLHEVRYPVRRALSADGDDGVVKLLDKCDNTMRACMDGGMLDNSDRDRGRDLFALGIFARAAMLTYDDSVLPLVRESLLRVAAGGALMNNAGSPFAAEHPVASLLFCSRLGAIAAYYYRTGDAAPVKALYPLIGAYLQTWEAQDGRVTPRRGDARFTDAGYNADDELITTCLYYSAVKFLTETAEDAEQYVFPDELARRAAEIEENFAANYLRDGYFSSGTVCDERANALAVLTGLAGENAPVLKDALCSCYNASPAFEGFVIEALGRVGGGEAAYDRLLRRYRGWILSESTVLPEYFFHAGSACSSASVSPVTAYVSGVLGVRYTGKRRMVIALPEKSDARAEIPAGCGNVRIYVKGDTAIVENNAGIELEVTLGNEVIPLAKGKLKRQR